MKIFADRYIFSFVRSHWLLILVVFGAVLRVFDLNWDGVFNFHPDEINIAGAVNRLSLSNNLNPDFFAYGSFPIYLNFAVKNLIFSVFGLYLNEYLIGRFISVIASVGCILLVYRIGILVTRRWSEHNRKIVLIIATFLTAFSPALIQAAHFMTFETLLSFEYLGFIYFILKSEQSRKNVYLFLSAVLMALAVATKITSLFLIPILIVAIYRKVSFEKKFRDKFSQFVIVLFFSAIIFGYLLLILFPYLFISWDKFIQSINYESMVASGSLKVFYTREFFDTIPVFFQIDKQFDFLLGSIIWLVLFGVGGYQILCREKNKIPWILLALILVLGFLPQCFLFVKWIRYSVTFVPVFTLIIGAGAVYLVKLFKIPAVIMIIFLCLVSLSGSILFMNVYVQNDTRIMAAKWAERNISASSKILSETYDLGIMPFNSKFMENITLFDFYELDNALKTQKLASLLQSSDYFISPSRRISGNTKYNQAVLPEVYNFYQSLENGQLGFDLVQIFKTKTNYYFLGYDPQNLEGTFEAFDHPTVKIYKKVKQLSLDEYEKTIQK